MGVKKSLFEVLGVFIFFGLETIANAVGNDSNINCRVSKPLRKQIDAEPLDGSCLRDIVSQLSKTLRNIGNEELAITSFQETLDNLEFVRVRENLDLRLASLAEKLNLKLKSYSEYLTRSNDAITPVLLAKISDNFYPSPLRIPDICSEISGALAASLRGSEWTHLHILPISNPSTACGPTNLSQYTGPLLLSRCLSARKVLLLIEHGISMSDRDVALVQLTAKTLVDMLSDNDYVNVVGLTGQGSIHCPDRLLRATDINKIQLTRHIDSITKTDSNVTFDLDLKALTRNITGEILVIHLTNSLNNLFNVKQIRNILSTELLAAHLRTVLILSDNKPTIKLNQLALNETIVTLPSRNVLSYDIARLFSEVNCTDPNTKNYYLSDPYFEPHSKTMCVSIGRITKMALLTLEIKLKDLVEDITYFDAGPNTHVVLFDKKGNVWMHRKFPRPEIMAEQPLRVPLENIENINESSVLKMTAELPEGSENFTTTLGRVKQFKWKHLQYGDLIVCIVTEGAREPLSIVKTTTPLPPDILHHRLDLLLQSVIDKDTLCSNHNRIVALHTGVVYLSPWCFKSPMEQLRLLETGSAMTVQSYMAYIKDPTRLLANPGLHQSVRPDVAMLSQILSHFQQRHLHSASNKFIVRRYVVAVGSGVMEVFPGSVLDTGLDPKRRAWYGKALEHPGKVTLTSPYLDAGGAGYVVTFSYTIFEGRSATLHSSNDPVLAVVSMDVTMGYIARLLLEMFPFCGDLRVKCFLMDDKGYLISHPALFEATNKVEQQHLTHKELLVANDILNHEFFVKKKLCANHLDGTLQRYYQFNTSLEEVLTNIVHGEHCVKYQVAAVPGTNVFLGVVNATCNLLSAFCPCSTMDRLCLNCKRMEQTDCECPCECPLYSGSCTESKVNNFEACPFLYEQGPSVQTSWVHPVFLKNCPSIDCKSFATARDCLGVIGCQWCHVDSDGETLLTSPYCSDQTSCFKGIFGAATPYGDGSYNSHSTEEIMVRDWPSIGPVAGGILALLLVLGIMLYCYRLRSVQPGPEHQCLHQHASPETLRMSHLDGDVEPMEIDQTKSNLDSLLRDGVAPISPYRVSTNYRRPPGGDSDHGYSTMTPHDDSEQQTFAEPLLLVGGSAGPDRVEQSVRSPSPTTRLGSPHHVLVPVTVHRNMETNYC
ncbi:VWFA and cache domain-containing protein 1 [Athalia rosae]|uniref:VWFA and cache domain-containing protein 1 n=1 Tax=Athalia rosae TaxID=37344 RepID=UPI0020333E41|nr:VWFA and cache domain-containing protein 1 [Athalia rosae]XP_048512216.1 VWFA and cache domain-containing protein 1 [Athalia rosae]XP_048512217.1 VWFA and cache domain-containing protein 1 [Athalia rosae]XP_048512218.1 VWFA and cache domain-containing protein 1 [Athalia rosae]